MPPLNPFIKTGLALAIGQGLALSSQAAVIMVETTIDEDPPLLTTPLCTLRDAITSMNNGVLANGCEIRQGVFGTNDKIYMEQGIASESIVLQTGELEIASNRTVSFFGKGVTVDAGDDSRVFNVMSNATFSISSVTVTGGSVSSAGGGINVSAAANLTVEDSKFIDNSADRGGAISFGGTSLTVRNSLFTDNRADRGGAALRIIGNAAEIIESTIDSNVANYNAGINVYGFDSRVTVLGSTISNNTATRDGGAIGMGVTTSITMSNSTISGNTSTANGSAMVANGSVVRFFNTTINRNTSLNGNETIRVRAGSDSATTVNSMVSLTNTIVANTLNGADCSVIGAANTVTSDTNSILQDGSCNTAARSLNPELDLLGNNGGPTLTHSLLANSPAINSGNNATCLETDQRGQLRARTGTNQCDVGAVEVQAPPGSGSIFVVPIDNGNAVIFEL